MTTARFDMTTDPECITLLADIRRLADRADALKRRIADADRHVVGHLWDVCRLLRSALDRAESDIAPRDE